MTKENIILIWLGVLTLALSFLMYQNIKINIQAQMFQDYATWKVEAEKAISTYIQQQVQPITQVK